MAAKKKVKLVPTVAPTTKSKNNSSTSSTKAPASKNTSARSTVEERRAAGRKALWEQTRKEQEEKKRGQIKPLSLSLPEQRNLSPTASGKLFNISYDAQFIPDYFENSDYYKSLIGVPYESMTTRQKGEHLDMFWRFQAGANHMRETGLTDEYPDSDALFGMNDSVNRNISDKYLKDFLSEASEGDIRWLLGDLDAKYVDASKYGNSNYSRYVGDGLSTIRDYARNHYSSFANEEINRIGGELAKLNIQMKNASSPYDAELLSEANNALGWMETNDPISVVANSPRLSEAVGFEELERQYGNDEMAFADALRQRVAELAETETTRQGMNADAATEYQPKYDALMREMNDAVALRDGLVQTENYNRMMGENWVGSAAGRFNPEDYRAYDTQEVMANEYGDTETLYRYNAPTLAQIAEDPEAVKKAYDQAIAMGADPSKNEDILQVQQMTDEELRLYQALYAIHGEEEAQRFYDHLAPELADRVTAAYVADKTAFAKEHPFLASAASIPEKFIGSLAGTADMIAGRDGKNQFSAISQAERETVAQNIADATPWANVNGTNLVSAAYQGAMSFMDSMFNRAITAGTGSAIAGDVLLGMGSASDAYANAYEATDGDRGKAVITGIASGLLEAGSDHISWGKLSNPGDLGVPGSVWKYIASASTTEGLEEVVSGLGGSAIESLVLGQGGEIPSRYKYYTQNGYTSTEAIGRIAKELGWETTLEFLIGALMGGTAAGVNTAVQMPAINAENRQVGERLTEHGDNDSSIMRGFLDLAGTLDLSRGGRKIYEELNGQYARNEALDGKNAQAQANAKQREMAEAAEELSTENAREELTESKNTQAQETAEQQKMAEVAEDLSTDNAKEELAEEKNAQARENAEERKSAEIAEELDGDSAREELAEEKNAQAQENAEQQKNAKVAKELSTENARAELAPGKGKAAVNKAKIGRLYREVMQKLEGNAQKTLRERMGYDVAKELVSAGVDRGEAYNLSMSILRVQDGSATKEDLEVVNGNAAARDVLLAYTAKIKESDEAAGKVDELRGLLAGKPPIKKAAPVTSDAPEQESAGAEELEPLDGEDEFDAVVAEVQAQEVQESEGETSTLDGEEIEVLGVEAAGDAESSAPARVRIRTADGAEKTVEAKEIAYSANDESVYALAAYSSEYGRQGDMMYNAYQPGQDVTEYARAFHKAAQAGSDGKNLDVLKSSGAVAVLNDKQLGIAYEIGRTMRTARSQAQQAALQAKGAGIETGKLDVSQISMASLNKQQRASVTAMGKLAKALGFNVRFVESKANAEGRYTTENGSYDASTRTLTLDVHAGSNYTGDTNYAVMHTAGHELTHYIKQFADSKLWDEFQDFVIGHLDKKMDLEAEIQKKMAGKQQLTRDAAIEEIIADASGEALSKLTEDQIQEMAETNPSLMKKIASFVKKWIGNLMRQIEIAFKGTEAKTEAARQMQDALDETAAKWNAMLANAGKQANATKAQKKAPAAVKAKVVLFEEYVAPDDLKYSTRDGIEFAEDKYYSRLIDQIESAKDGGYIRVGGIQEASVLNQVGLPATSLYFDVSKIKKQMEKHGDHLDKNVLKKIPDILRAPVVVAEAEAKNTVNVFGDLSIGDSPVMVAIMVARDRSGRNIINKVRTVHARRDFMPRITDEKVLYLDGNKKRTRNWFQARGNVVPLGGTRYGFIRSIAQPEDSVKFSMREPVESTKNLIAVHNLNEYKLGKALKLGGFPMPSIAIAKADIGHQNFGDISLVFGKETIDPKANRKNKVYSADAWTPTFPHIEYEADPKAEKRMRTTLTKLGNSMESYLNERLRQVIYGVDEYLNRYEGEEGFIEYAMQNYGVKAAFLEDQGQHVDMVRTKKRVGKVYPDELAASYQKVVDLFDGDMEKASHMPLDQIMEEYGAALEDIRPGSTKSAMRLSAIIRNAAEYQETASQPPRYEMVADYGATERGIDEQINKPEFEAWVRDLFSGIEGNSGVYNNKPLFTDSGNRRSFASTHMPVTVENIAKAMATQGNTKNVAGFHGIKSLRAATARTFKNVDEMHAYEGRIQNRTEDEAELLNRALNERLYDLIHEVLKVRYPNGNTGLDYTYAEDALGEVFLEMAESKYSVSSIQRTLAGYGYNVSSETAEAIKLLFDDTAYMPVNMYEAKPERAVGFDEVRFAAVPDDISNDLMNELRKVVPDVRTYPAGDEAARLAVLNSEDSVRFQERDPDQISDRELLATALQSVTQNADERDNLRLYQKKIATLNEKQRLLEQTNARIAELTAQDSKSNRDELIRLKNAAAIYMKQINRADGELLKYEAMKPIKKLADREREAYKQKLKAKTDEQIRRYKERVKMDTQDKIREIRERAKERADERVRKAVKEQREIDQRKVERLKESHGKEKYRAAIMADVKKLYSWVVSPTNKGHVPQFLREPLGKFLESIDLRGAKALETNDIAFSGNAQAIKEWEETLRNRIEKAQKRYEQAFDSFQKINTTGDSEKIKKAKTELATSKSNLEREQRALAAGVKESAKAYTAADRKFMDALDKLRYAISDLSKQQSDIEGGANTFAGYIDLPSDYMAEFDALVRKIKTTLEIGDGMTDTAFNRMTADQLHEMSKLFRILNSSITKMNRLVANGRYESARTASNDTITDMNAMNAKVKTNKVLSTLNSMFNWKNTTPYYAFQRLGRGGKAIFEGLQDGWDKMARNSAELIAYAKEAFTAKQAKAWSKDIQTIELDSGESVQMTVSQIMSLYCLSKREQAVGHLKGGGIRVSDIDAGKGNTISQVDNYILSEADIARITGKLTAEQKAVADKLQKFMNTTCSEWGNEISMKRFGYEMFTEKNYFPIETDANNRSRIDDKQDGNNSMFRLLNMSAMKQLTPNANNAIIVRDIFDVFSNHASDIGKYNALALPILDFIKWYNFVERADVVDEHGKPTGQITTRSTQKALERAYGSDAKSYLMNFIKDLNAEYDGGRNDTVLSKLMGTAKAGSVNANMRVGFLQITSLPRAAYAINAKYLLGGMAKLKNLNPVNAVRGTAAQEDIGILKWKSLGFYSTDVARSTRGLVRRDDSAITKVRDLLMKPAEWGDNWVSNIIYEAVKLEMKDKHPALKPGTKAYDAMLNKRVREIVYKTQVVDSTMTRSDFMRSKGLMTAFTAFMSEPTLTVNMLNESIQEAVMNSRAGMSKSENLKSVGGKAVKAAATFAFTALASALVESIFDAMRDDDDYEELEEKFAAAFTGNVVDNVNVLGMLPILKDLVSIAQGYENNSMVTQAATQIMDMKKAIEAVQKGGRPVYSAIYNALKVVASITGVGVQNATRDVVALYNTFLADAWGMPRVQTYENSKSEAAKAYYAALQDDNDERADWIRERIEVNGMKFADLADSFVSILREDYLADAIDADTAEEYLVELAGKKSDDAATTVLKWQYKKETGLNYSDLKADYLAGKISEKLARKYLAEIDDLDEEEIDERLGSYEYAGETGLNYSEIKQDYISGKISEAEAREYLATVEGLDEEEVDSRISNYDYTAYTGKNTAAPKYWRLVYVYENGGDYKAYADQIIDEIIADAKAKGKKKSWKQARNAVASSLASYYKKDYLAIKGTPAGDAMLEQILDVYEAIGYSRSYERKYIDEKWELDEDE